LSKDKERGLPDSKKEEQGPLTKVIYLAPLLALIFQILELLLKILGKIN
jgi:hypothetical protein